MIEAWSAADAIRLLEMQLQFDFLTHSPFPPPGLRTLAKRCYGRNGLSDETESDPEPGQSLAQVVRIPQPLPARRCFVIWH
jgi:hypothetical protein